MKSIPLIINWHDQNAPVYSAHFEPNGKGRLATAGGDNNVRLWKIEAEGDLLASAGDDGNVILWVLSETHQTAFGSDGLEDKETWRARHMCRSSGAEIYDLAWSPDGSHFIIGSMDNIARIYNTASASPYIDSDLVPGYLVRQIAEHSHYVQGVAWDPLNEFIATQSSDRSVHIYSLRTKDGQYTLNSYDDAKPPKLASHAKADLPPRRISSSSPAPPDFGVRAPLPADSVTSASINSPVPSAPGTPNSLPLPMNPPSVMSHSRRSSFSSRRSPSPAPSMPLPAVMPMEASPKPPSFLNTGLGVKNASLYANETLTSFFRRLTFTPDGSLLLTPSGQYQTQHQTDKDSKPTYEVINTVYIYTRGGINKAPIAHLPGHKKPSVAHITIDTSSAEEPIPELPEPLSGPSPGSQVMEPPPPPTCDATSAQVKPSSADSDAATAVTGGPKSAFILPYRMIYAVATQDSVFLYDTQQQTPLCVVSNLHCATFTDLTWSSDGLTLLITSSDGFCSTLSFAPGELGEIYTGDVPSLKNPTLSGPVTSAPVQNMPVLTPTSAFAPPSPYHGHQHRNSTGSFTAPSPPTPALSFPAGRPSSPARSTSASSVTTQASTAVLSNPPLIVGSVPGIVATNSGKVTGVPITTPPETPRNTSTVAGVKRDASEAERDEVKEPKKRRVAPTPVTQDPKPEAS
ncbi:Uncharacterized protein SAPIO_CDS6117 [Scedosporium apiospermum]|uniref:CAF1B/HIR1 beta-propeller domain-containing protein n=1 Tax=Pseudallescheria apiosperma TaxID=563466 RepID=A0A084G4J7_PSEDA|nr:Uncharacterized protein SAPIO_CDS6117 [Scedosporium apiospermum]KEZ42259.1 Uncharacterized protein SAPIO_CDS6117 [Scedosporium apiospermum]